MVPSFSTKPEEFDTDNRISPSKVNGKFVAVDDDGTKFEFDVEQKKWMPTSERRNGTDAVDYGEVAAAASDDDNDGAYRKRKLEVENERQSTEASTETRPMKKTKAPAKVRQNTAVYVTGLPQDATVAEIHDLFSRKGGLIAEEIDSHEPRIKRYMDEAGQFKGDALVVFFKPESVRMAMMLLDDSDFRLLPNGKGEGRIRVQEADSSYKKVQYDQDGAAKANGGPQQGGNNMPRTAGDRQKIIKKTQKLDARLADWSDGEDDRFPGLAETKRKSKKVVLRQMFRIFQLEEDPASVLEIKDDIREECSKMGTVTSVVLYDQEPEGIVTVKFKEAEAAERCVKTMDGRQFDGRVVVAELATGKERFRKSDDLRDGDSD